MESKNKYREAALGVVENIRNAVGEAKVRIEDEKEFSPDVIVTVSSAEEVAAVVRMAAGIRVAALGTAAFCGGGIAVDLSKMNKVSVSKADHAVKAQAGAGFKEIIAAAAAEGMVLGSMPFDLSEPVGSWAASEAVGNGTYKYGPAKDNLLNAEIVLNDGTVIEPGYDEIGSYMSGYNFIQLIPGSEGTLGIVTAVTLKLHPAGVRKAVSYAFSSDDDAVAFENAVIRDPGLKPINFTFCTEGGKTVFTLEYQGEPEFVELDTVQTDGLAAAANGAKTEAAAAFEPAGKAGVIVPLANAGAYIAAVGGKAHGAVADRYTAYFIADSDNAAGEAAKLGGREARNVLVGDRIDAIRDEGTAAFMKALKEFFKTGEYDVHSGDRLKRAINDKILDELKDILGKDNVNTSPEEKILYTHDLAPLPKLATIAFDNMPDAVLRPSKTSELSQIMKVAYREGIPVTPRGNSTWGLGGSQPAMRGLVVDFSSKMNKISIDPVSMTATIQAGATWKEALEAAEEKGFLIGSMPSSFPAGTIGAWLGTNGMGIGSYKYGSAKDNVLSLEAVLPDGTVINTGYKNMGSYYSGYNLNQFFAGSEGTLCLFASATFRIYPRGTVKPVAYEFLNSLAEADPVIQGIIANASVTPLHISWSDENHFRNQHRAHVHAPDVKNILLVTFQGDDKHIALEEAAVEEFVARAGGRATAPEVGEHEWAERCYEFRARKAGVGEIPAEVIIPAKRWGAFVPVCYKGFDDMKMELGGIIGEVVDDNTVLWMPYYFKDDESMLGMTAFAFNFYLGDRAAEYGGRTTGFGIFFAWNLDNVHDPNTVSLMREFKTFEDPHDVMNPGHVTCGMSRFGVNLGHGIMSMMSTVMQMAKKLMPPNTTFADNIERFDYNRLEEEKEEDRKHVLGRGYE